MVEPEFCNLMTVYISYSLAGCLVVCVRVVNGVVFELTLLCYTRASTVVTLYC